MRVAILAGGRGTRWTRTGREEPKPLARIGDRPILWHVMRGYREYGFNDFVVALGHRADEIAAYFRDETAQDSSLDLLEGEREATDPPAKGAWRVQLVDTGLDTASGGRLLRLAPWLERDTFMLTWSDGLSDVPLDALVRFHADHGRIATVTAVHPPARFGRLTLQDQRVVRFEEKVPDRERWINGAFFVLEPGVMEYIGGDEDAFEGEPMQRLVADGELHAYCHEGFWQCMDFASDRGALEQQWGQGRAPWKTWS